MGSFPYTNVTVHYPTGPAAAGLIDVEPSPFNLVEQGNVGLKVGDGSVAGNGDARGPCNRFGSGPNFRAGIAFDGTHWDCRGAVSVTMIGWFRLNSLTGHPQLFSVWSFANANEQFWVLHARPFGPPTGPAFTMYDGLTINNVRRAQASASNNPNAADWHMCGGSWNHVTNIVTSFWGDGSDPTGNTFFFNSTTGFSAGFGASVDVQSVNCARFSDLNEMEIDVDHLSYWRDRAFDEEDYLNHWQAGTGLARSEFAVDPGRGFGGDESAAEFNYYWQQRRRRA